jgi:hypothetical protein
LHSRKGGRGEREEERGGKGWVRAERGGESRGGDENFDLRKTISRMTMSGISTALVPAFPNFFRNDTSSEIGVLLTSLLCSVPILMLNSLAIVPAFESAWFVQDLGRK